ncbi:MAG: hypothetical protein ACMUIA_08575 [bacterium]
MKALKVSWLLCAALFFLAESTLASYGFSGYTFDYRSYLSYNQDSYKFPYMNVSLPDLSSFMWNNANKAYHFPIPQKPDQIAFGDWFIRPEWEPPFCLQNGYNLLSPYNLYTWTQPYSYGHSYPWTQPYYYGYSYPFLKINNSPKKNPTEQEKDPTEQADMDYEYSLRSIQERLKREVDFDNWPCQNGPIRAGIIFEKAHFSSFQEAEAVHGPHAHIMDEVKDTLGTEYTYRWEVEEKGKADIRVIVTQACLQAQNFLIRRYAECSMPPEMIHIGPRGEEYDIRAGDVSFVSGMDFHQGSSTRIRFVRNNIYVEITVYDEMRKEMKSIAEDLDHILLSRPAGEEAINLKPVIRKFWATKDTVQPDEKDYLTLEIESPTSDPVIWTPPEIICLSSGGCSYPDGEVIVAWRKTQGYVGRDEGYVMQGEEYRDFYYRSDVEGLHTITLLVSDSTGLISSEQIKIRVTD